MATWARPNGIPAATQRSQKPDTMSISAAPAKPACVSQADNSVKKASFMSRLYSLDDPFQTLPTARAALAMAVEAERKSAHRRGLLCPLHHRDAAAFHRQRQLAVFERERFLAE